MEDEDDPPPNPNISKSGSTSSFHSSDDAEEEQEQEARIRALQARSSILRLEQQSVQESNEQISLILETLYQRLLVPHTNDDDINANGVQYLALGQLNAEQLELLLQLVEIEDRLAHLRRRIGADSDTALERELQRAQRSSNDSDDDDEVIIPIDQERLEQRLQELLQEQRQQHLGETVVRIEDDHPGDDDGDQKKMASRDSSS